MKKNRIFNATTRFVYGSLGLCATLCVTEPAYAVERLLTIGANTAETTEGVVTVNANDTFLVDFTANRSYACEGIPTDTLSDFDWSLTVVGTGTSAESVTARAAGTIAPPITGETNGSSDNRITLTPTTTDRFRLTVAQAKSGGETVKVRCFATTMFGGYNTTVNDFNFLELTNIGNAVISGTITAINFDGTTVISGQSFSVDPQQRIDIDLHTPAGPDKFGILRVTHNGPLGTLKGNVSEYTGTVTDFTLTDTIPLKPFEQKP